MFTQQFLVHLEYEISIAFSNSLNPNLKGFWCDGILLTSNENEYSKKTINDKRQLILKAFIGKDGQDEYKMTLHFGRKSLSKIQRNLDLKSCIPNSDNDEWIIVDKENKKIEIYLY
jgi:hypothetical protein